MDINSTPVPLFRDTTTYHLRVAFIRSPVGAVTKTDRGYTFVIHRTEQDTYSARFSDGSHIVFATLEEVVELCGSTRWEPVQQ